jgi:transposase
MAAEHIFHMQKSLSLMNVQIHHVLSDITGLSGLAILDAIVAGGRDCVKLAQLCHPSVKSPREKIAQALQGDYRPEHLFVLQQSVAGYRYSGTNHRARSRDSAAYKSRRKFKRSSGTATEANEAHKIPSLS